MSAQSEKKLMELKGNDKAVILIGLLPEDLKRDVIQGLDKEEKLDLARKMKDQTEFTEEEIQFVMLDYIKFMNQQSLGIAGSKEAIYNLFKDSMDEEELEQWMHRLYHNEAMPFETIKKLTDVKPLITILQKEDPQTIAIVASFLKAPQASQLLQALPPEKMSKVAHAIAQLDQPNQDVLSHLEEEINKMLNMFVSDEKSQTDGIKTLVDIINNVPRSTEKLIFTYLDEVDGELSEEVRNKLFIFEDIAKLELRDVMSIVNEVTEDVVIAKALRGAQEEMKVLFYNAMSEGRKERVADADAVIGKIKLQDVEEAQQEISNIAKNLEKDGKITVSRGEDDVIL